MNASTIAQQSLIERAAALNYGPVPIADGNPRDASEAGWRSAIAGASRAGLLELSDILAAAEDARAQAERYRVPERRVPDPEAPLGARDEQADALIAESQCAAAFRRTPEGRAEHQIALLEQILEELRARK
jgi:hypothetical protein